MFGGSGFLPTGGYSDGAPPSNGGDLGGVSGGGYGGVSLGNSSGGFLASQPGNGTSSTQALSPPKQNSQCVMPATVKMLLSQRRTFQENDSMLSIHGRSVSIVTLVACVRAFESQGNQETYVVSDATGRITVTRFINVGEPATQAARVGQYVRIYGNVRAVGDDLKVSAFHLCPLDDANEISLHEIEVANTYLALTGKLKKTQHNSTMTQPGPQAAMQQFPNSNVGGGSRYSSSSNGAMNGNAATNAYHPYASGTMPVGGGFGGTNASSSSNSGMVSSTGTVPAFGNAGAAPSQSAPSTFPASTGNSNSGQCFKCGQSGHWARDCPQGGGGSSSVSVNGGQPGSCFKCGQPGHWASSCPNNQGRAFTGDARGVASTTASNVCFKCGRPGHWANACPGM